jgi:phosphate transport system substrate-binding protein
MTKSSQRRAMTACAFVFTLALALPASAQQQTLFCLSDGTQINAERFETRDGKFLLYVPGAAQPLEYPSSSVKGINVRCDPMVAPAAAPGIASGSTPAPQTQSSGRFGIHGSNTIGERLMPMLIESYGIKKLGSKPTSKLTASEEQEITVKSPSGAPTLIDLQAHGSGTSAKGLIDGKSLIGMSSRRINAEETAAVAARFKVDAQTPGNEHVLALDGLAVIVNASNSVKQLNLDQIGRIFAGQITNWSEVGGANRPINVFRRDDKSGTTDTFKFLVMAANKLSFAPAAKPFESSETVSSSVASDLDAIGFIGLPYINQNHALGITSTCGISSSPSRYTIKTETYPLGRRLYLYTIGAPTDPTARDLLQFMLSDEAQSTVQEAEFVEQTVDFQDDAEQRAWIGDIVSAPNRGLLPDKEVPREMLRTLESSLGSMRRTSLMFRFESRSAALDTRAQQDVGRLARFLNAPAMAGKKFLVAGFADSRGGWAANRGLAMDRAVEVARELERVGGIRVPRENVLSFSFMAPTACNDSDIGLSKNRRVEIWVAP